MIKDLTPRLYQETILGTCIEKNTLVVLPTGLGKSIIFVLLAVYRLQHYPKEKVIILAPTKPLCEQHVKTLEQFMDVRVALFTGEVSPEERAEQFEHVQVIVSTPQGLENDLISNRISFKNVSLLVFDECHRAVKDYAYVWLAERYAKQARYPRILGLTASPGNELEHIQTVCKNLHVEAIEVRTEEDSDVKPYVQDVETQFVEVTLPEAFKQIQHYFALFMKEKKEQLGLLGILPKASLETMSKRALLDAQASLQGSLAQGDKQFSVLKSVSVLAEIMKMQHAIELLETQGMKALQMYLDKIEQDSRNSKTKAVKNIVQNVQYRSAKILVDKAVQEEVEHPKLETMKSLVEEHVQTGKVIVFNQYRDTAAHLLEELNQLSGVTADLLVGQAKKNGTGLRQKEQIALLDRFRKGEVNVLVMTSIGEEGLDIDQVGTVIFYEPIPSAIRTIQRKGRTGRKEEGKVIVLVAKGTRDEAYRWSSFHKEKKMYKHLHQLKEKIVFEKQEQVTLQDYQQRITVYADHREKASKSIKYLIEQGVQVELQQLDVADYVLSEDVGVELKTVPDFVHSLVDGRLLEQIKALKYTYKRPLLILEGEEDLYSVRNVHPNALRGMLATITISYGIPLLQTKHFRETAEMLIAIAKREQEGKQTFSPHSAKKIGSLQEEQEYFISSLPNIGMKIAKELLGEFKTPKKIVNATVEELKKVGKIGEKTAQRLLDVFEKEH